MAKSEQRTRARARKAAMRAVRDPERAVLGPAARRNRKPWGRLTNQEREQIVALLAITDNRRAIARKVGAHPETVRKIEQELDEVGELYQLRARKRTEYVEEGWTCIMLSLQTIRDGLSKGYVSEVNDGGRVVSMVSKVTPVEAAKVIQVLHQSIMRAEPERRSIVDELAEKYTEEELRAELDRLEKELRENRGRLQ